MCFIANGFWKNRLFTGLSQSDNSNLPDTKMILMVGHRSWTVRASPKPSMLPGIWMSVKSSAMSERRPVWQPLRRHSPL
jgi:hypothetical protein